MATATILRAGADPVAFTLTAEQEAALQPRQTTDDARKKKQTSINEAFQAGVASITQGILQPEIDTFSVQEKEAMAYQADPEADIPFVSALAEAREITISDLVDRILAKAAAYKSAMAYVMGRKHKAEDALDAATTVEQIKAIEV